jgi:hypothetical protein
MRESLAPADAVTVLEGWVDASGRVTSEVEGYGSIDSVAAIAGAAMGHVVAMLVQNGMPADDAIGAARDRVCQHFSTGIRSGILGSYVEHT